MIVCLRLIFNPFLVPSRAGQENTKRLISVENEHVILYTVYRLSLLINLAVYTINSFGSWTKLIICENFDGFGRPLDIVKFNI